MAVATRERILTSARDHFLASGADGVSMRRVADGAGVSAMAIYRHFENREALLRAVVDQGFAIFFDYLNRGMAADTPAERLRRAGRQYLRFALEHPEDYAMMFMERGSSVDVPGDLWWRDAATFRFLVDRIRDCMDAGDLRRDDPESVALIVWAQCHGLVSLYLAGKLAVEEERFAQMYEEAVAGLMLGRQTHAKE